MTTTTSQEIRIPDTMWALELRGAGFQALSVVERPTPKPGPLQALCRVEAASVCSTDGELVELGGRHRSLFGWDPERWPIIPGHEGSLVVVAVGQGLGNRLRVGQRLVVLPMLAGPPRLDLDRYREPLRNICSITLGFTVPGLLAQYVLLREDVLEAPDSLVPIAVLPSSLPHFGAALAEPFSTVLAAHAKMVHILKEATCGERTYRAGILPGGVTAVIGAGPMGIMHVSYSLLRRPRHLVVSEPDPARRACASRLKGLADMESTELYAVPPSDLGSCVRAVSQGRGADDIIFAVGDSRAEEEALALAAPGSCISFFSANPLEESSVRVNALDILYKSIALSGSSGSESQDLRRAIELQERGAVDMSPFVAAVGGIDAAPAALRGVSEGRFGGKVVIYPHVRAPELVSVAEWGPEAEARFLEEAT